MKRRVVLHGPSTLIISLPAQWVKKFHIARGDELDVEEEGPTLKISTKKEASLQQITIDISGFRPLVARLVKNIYHRGYDRVTLTFDDDAVVADIERTLPELTGFEIMGRSGSECIIQDISGPSETEFPIILRRFCLLVKMLVDDAPDVLARGSDEALAKIIAEDEAINRLANFSLRLLNKQMIGKREHLTHYYIVHQLEAVADQYKHLARRVLQERRRLSTRNAAHLKQIREFFAMCYEMQFSKQKLPAVRMAQLYKEIRNSIDADQSVTIDESRDLHHISSIVELLIPILSFQFADMI